MGTSREGTEVVRYSTHSFKWYKIAYFSIKRYAARTTTATTKMTLDERASIEDNIDADAGHSPDWFVMVIKGIVGEELSFETVCLNGRPRVTAMCVLSSFCHWESGKKKIQTLHTRSVKLMK